MRIGIRPGLFLALAAVFALPAAALAGPHFSGWTAAQKMTLNESFYAQRREAVKKKLGVAADGFIAGLEVG